jgi:hypothetical protein
MREDACARATSANHSYDERSDGTLHLRFGARVPVGAILELRRDDGELVLRAEVPPTRELRITPLPLTPAQQGWDVRVSTASFQLMAYLAFRRSPGGAAEVYAELEAGS